MPSESLQKRKAREEVGTLPVLTLVLWIGCSAVGWLGTRPLMPVRLLPPPTSAPMVQTTLINVTLEETPPEQEMPPADEAPAGETPAPAAEAPPPVPSAAVAMPSPLIAFAQPIEGPVHIVSAALATPTRAISQSANPNNTIVAAPPQRLTIGVGEGNQPPPEYPEEARTAHQHGTVSVRFYVDEAGNVTSVQIVKATPFPLLNEAVLRRVKNEWHFSTGPPRCYDFDFDFSLKQRQP